MTYQEILTDVDDRYSNGFTQAQKIRWLNTVLKKIYKDTGMQEGYKMTTVKGQAIYTLPSDLELSNIKAMTVDKKAYKPKKFDENIKGDRCYYMVDDTRIGIYPTPSKDGLAMYIFYIKKPTPVTTETLTSDIEISDDYEELIKYGIFIIMAEADDDIAKVNNYKKQYNALLADAKQTIYEQMSKYSTIQDVMTRRATTSDNRKLSEEISRTLEELQ